MVSAFRAAAFAVLFCLAAMHPAGAQQEPGQGASDADSYKPPARFIAKEPDPRAQKPAAAAKPAEAPVAGRKTIGLVSVIGETLTVKKVGITVFGNEEHKIPIASWKIDDRAAAITASILKRSFNIKRIAVPAGTYDRYETGELRNTDYRERRRRMVVEFATPHKCDYYLLIAPGGSIVGITNQGIGGLGVLRLESLFAPKEAIHALTELSVYDSQFKRLRSEDGSIGQDTFLVAIKGPNQELQEGDRLPPDPKAAAADPRVQKIAWQLLEKSLTMTVPKLFAAN